MIAIIDYGAGNLFSVKNAMDYLEIASVITNDEKEIRNADGMILPGVGAFPFAMDMLKKSELDKIIKEETVKKPLLGIASECRCFLRRASSSANVRGWGLSADALTELQLRS